MKEPIVFLAGASGAIGKRLIPLLIESGYRVLGTTRSPEKMNELQDLGATPIVMDVFNSAELTRILRQAQPSIVMHQLTNLPKTFAGPLSDQTLRANARLRDEGTRNLIHAAIAAGARRFIAQSVAWVYAPGPLPHAEEDPLDRGAVGLAAITMAGVVALEGMTLNSPALQGVVLRYGQLYGPGTWNTAQNGTVPVHVDAAAHAALLAIGAKHVGVFNIAEEKGMVSANKARRELGWSATFRVPASRSEAEVK